MNHELAEQLRDAGCPGFFDQGDNGGIHIPALSELIGACEEEYFWLQHRNISGTRDWLAEAHTLNNGQRFGIGSTPEEAIARLWLALNSK